MCPKCGSSVNPGKNGVSTCLGCHFVFNEKIENNFKYHAPKEGQLKKYEGLRQKAKELAYLIDELCPDSREKSLAMTTLESSVMWANASIARNQEE